MGGVVDEEDEEEADEEDHEAPNKSICPEIVFAVDAPDEFLKARIESLPSEQTAGTNLEPVVFERRLDKYRRNNSEDETVLNYFDYYEIHPEFIDLSQDKSEIYRATVERLKKLIGEPKNYGPSEEERLYNQQLEDEEKKAQEEVAKVAREEAETKEKERLKSNTDDWAEKVKAIKFEQLELAKTQSLPLRHYLMQNVMPTLTQGLVECVRHRPDDAVDFVVSLKILQKKFKFLKYIFRLNIF